MAGYIATSIPSILRLRARSKRCSLRDRAREQCNSDVTIRSVPPYDVQVRSGRIATHIDRRDVEAMRVEIRSVPNNDCGVFSCDAEIDFVDSAMEFHVSVVVKINR